MRLAVSESDLSANAKSWYYSIGTAHIVAIFQVQEITVKISSISLHLPLFPSQWDTILIQK